MQDLAYRRKISLNPKQVQEVIFLRKANEIIHPVLYFNNATVKLADAQKHLGPQSDGILSFNKHANNKISDATKGGFIVSCNLFYHAQAY